MPISYAGFPLLLDDPDGVVQAWLDRWHALDDIRPCQEVMARRGNRANHTKGQKNGRGLPIPNYPPPPPVRLNVLHWPTGAARWGTFFALCDATTAADIQAVYKAAAASAGSQSFVAPYLVLADGETTLEIEMHLLTPRVVTVAGNDQNARQLFILPLVDDRYFWQFQGIGDDASGISAIATNLNRTITQATTPPAAYGAVDWLETNRQQENAGVMLDAFAHGFGQRFVRRLDGTNEVLTWTDSATTLVDTNLVDYQQIAGGIASHILPGAADPAPVPATVRVVFRFWRDGIVIDCDFEHRGSVFAQISPTEFSVDISASDIFGSTPPQGTVGGMVKVIYSTMYAIIGYGTTERAAPTNETELEDLAEQVATDFYASLDYQYDLTFAGLKDWRPTGYDDHIEIQMDGDSGAVTRVQSTPPNFGAEVNLSQSTEDVFVLDDQCIVLLGSLSRYAGAGNLGVDTAAAVYEPIRNRTDSNKELEDTGLTITVFSIWGNDDQGDVSGVFALATRVFDVWVVAQTDTWATPQEPAGP